MGADFCCAIFPIPKKPGTRDRIDLNFDAALKAIETTDWLKTELNEAHYCGSEDVEIIKAELLAALIQLRNILEKEPRDIGWIERPTEWLLVSGGMTCGDSPTDAFDVLYVLDVSGLTDVLITTERKEND
jgi:hypothetical protein